MRRTSLQFGPPLQFLAAAPTDVSATTMSSRPPYRGGFRRGFSDRPNAGGRGQRGQFVTGDSHFRSVRDANLGHRRGDSGGFADQSGGFGPQHHYPRPPAYAQNAQFCQTPPYNKNNHDNNNNNNSRQWNRPNRQFDPNAGPRPPQQFRPKPLDYRNWEYATLVRPTESERFIVLSYNILADYLANNHRNKLYYHIPRYMLDWEWRKKNILFELRLWSADIMCFQEVDKFQELEEELKHRGYSGIWKMRTGIPVDGCAIFWRTSRFKLLHEECIEFNKHGLRDNVAQICVLESINQNCAEETGALPQSSSGSCKVVICNIHVLYNPRRGEIKLGQVRVLLNKAYSVSKLWDDAPVIVCGDFNCTPKSPLYNFISEQKLDISGLDRDKVSGQATAEIPAGRRYNSNSETGSVKSSILDPPLVDGKEVNMKLSDSVSDIQKTNPDSNMENIPAVDNSLPQYVDTGLDVSDESSTDMQSAKDDSTLHDELRKETQQDAVDGCVSTLGLPVDGSSELSSTSYSEDELPVDCTNNGIHKHTLVALHPEEVYTDVTHTESSEKVNVPAHSNMGSLVGHVELNDYVENENVNCNESKNSFQGNHDLAVARTDPEHADNLKSEISSSEPSCLTSCSNAFEVFPPGNSENISPHQKLCDDLGEKLENLSLNELDKSVAEGGDVGEDDSRFLSALHNSGDAFPSDFSQLRSDLAVSDNSKELECIPHSSPLNLLGDEVEDDLSPSLDPETFDMEKTAYDPSLWTPMEIETASGNAECKLLEHPLMLGSTYTEVKDCSGTRDSNGEPLVTSYNRCFFGTVDYIWRSEGLQTVRVLAPMQKQAMQWTPGFPTKKWGSDHIALAAELALVKDVRNHNTEVQEQ